MLTLIPVFERPRVGTRVGVGKSCLGRLSWNKIYAVDEGIGTLFTEGIIIPP